ncbi:MAG: hypothetical protein IPP15_20395 [Saprospiraceae bacterium]|uniref:Uncharacterized protein n=1 Tax=Candidatus Opimibacter skivensis TaxID=2982028 RepID=A0A9D7SYR0_9BACT|nr:hypothetical protein [Candidatus Opimibacter skivensis]
MISMSIEQLSSLFTILAIFLAGAWTLFRFGISREQYPKLQFDLKLKQLGISRDKYIVELVAVIRNKGIARQYIQDFRFNILTFDDETPFDTTDVMIERRLKFTKFNMTVDPDSKGELKWIDTKYPVFVDGGITREFRYVTALDHDVRFVMIYSKFDHESRRWGMDRSEHYRISKTFAIER